MKQDVLFTARYIGKNKVHFTFGDVYSIVGLDENRNYYVLDDFCYRLLDYKSNFEKISD